MKWPERLPDFGTNIFTLMSRRAAEEGALNIGQGYPDYPLDPRLAQFVTEAIAQGHNQYAPMAGVPALLQAIAAVVRDRCGIALDTGAEITVTCGATEAIYSALQAFVGAGDEVLVLDPAYDAYVPGIRLAGGVPVRFPVEPPSFQIDWAALAGCITPRTRVLVFNNPHNPACAVASAADLDALADLAERNDLLVIGDEVYEHAVYDGTRHRSLLASERLRARSVAIYSFGKSLHATGWRLGYAVAPPALTRQLRRIHQYTTFSLATPLQHAVARYLEQCPDALRGLSGFFEAKRDRLVAGLAGTGFSMQPARGTYFQLLGYEALSDDPDVAFADRLIREAKVATIPLSPFYADAPRSVRQLRVCIAKQDETLDVAILRLRQFAARVAA